MKKNNIIIVILVILLAVLAVVGFVYGKERQARLQTGKPLTPDIPTKEDGVLNLSGVSVYFDKSTGKITSSEVGHYVTNLITEYVPDLIDKTKEIENEDDLNVYFETNLEELKERFGVMNFNEFKALYNSLHEKKIDYSKYDRLVMDKTTFIDSSEETPKKYYSYVKCKVYYIDDSVIDFDLYVRFREHSSYPTYIVDFK